MSITLERVDFPTHERPTTDVSMGKVLLYALVITVGFLGMLYPMKGTFVRDLMMGRNEIAMDRLIFQGLTFYMWALSTANILLKYLRIRKERAVLNERLLPADLDMIEDRALVKAYEALTKRPDFKERIAVTRIARVLAMWINCRDFDRAVQYAKEESELDMYLSDSSFRANRLFIWAMPLLGFVGTVYGVSYGIGGFADFLSGNVTAEGIKEQVGLITEGLAVAFYTTLVGLLTAGGAAFPSLGAERKEEGVLGDLDAYVEEHLISKMPSVSEEEFPQIKAIRDGIDAVKETLVQAIAGLATSIENGFRLLPTPAAYESVFANAIASASGMINQKYNEFATHYEDRVASLGRQLSERMDAAAAHFQEGARAVVGELHGQARIVQQAGEQQAQRLTEATQLVAQRWESAVAAQREAAASLTTHLDQAAARMGDAAAAHGRQVAESAQALGAQLQRVQELGSRIDQMLHTSAAMESALAKIGGSEQFGRTLAALQQHLAASDELVHKLSRPRKVVFEETVG